MLLLPLFTDAVVVVEDAFAVAGEERFPTKLFRNCSMRHRLVVVVAPVVDEFSIDDVFIVGFIVVVRLSGTFSPIEDATIALISARLFSSSFANWVSG